MKILGRGIGKAWQCRWEGLGRIMERPGKRLGLKFWKKEEWPRNAGAKGGRGVQKRDIE